MTVTTQSLEEIPATRMQERVVLDRTSTTVGSKDSPLRLLRRDGARPPVVCFFPGAPGARDFAEHLPEDQPVYEFYELNMDKEAVYPTVEQLAEIFLTHLKKVQPHGPYQLCGYSTFGLVAYEIARRLDSQGENVSLLALFDITHPKFVQDLPRGQFIRYRILRVVDRVIKYAQVLGEGRLIDFASRFHQFVVRRTKSIAWRATRPMFRTANRPVPKTMQVIESIASHKAFSPLPYPKRLVLFRPTDAVENYLRDRTLGWHRCAAGGLDIHFVRGDHGNVVRSPNVRDLAAKLTPYLAEAPRTAAPQVQKRY